MATTVGKITYHTDLQWGRLKQFTPHPDNPNEMTVEKLNQLTEEMRSKGFRGGIFARTHPDGGEVDGLPKLQILDGEHRWKALFAAADDDPEADIPFFMLEMDDVEAQYTVYQMNQLKGELNPIKLAVWLQNLRKMDTPDAVYHRTRLASRRQEKILERLNPEGAAEAERIGEEVREGYKVFAVTLTESEYETVMRALRMTRLYHTDEELLRVCEEFYGCKHVKTIQEEKAKALLKQLDEGMSLIEVCDHFTSCDDAREVLKAELLSRYKT